MTLLHELTELSRINAELSKIQNDPAYIKKRTREIFGDVDSKSIIEKAIAQEVKI